MENTKLAYAAGYIDGDGYFGISPNNTYRLTMVSIHKENIEWFKNNFEGTVSNAFPRDKTRKHTYQFRFKTKSLDILYEMRPFFVEKVEECDLLMEFREIYLRRNKIGFYERMHSIKFHTNLIEKSMKEELDKTKVSIQPTVTDFAYLAGWIDAECSLDIQKHKQPRKDAYCYIPQIQCNNTKIPFFRWAANRFGGNFYFLNASKYRSNRRNQMIWRLRGKNAYSILKGIFPFLNHKKAICQELINMEETEFGRKDCPSPNHPRFREYFEPIMRRKEEIYHRACHLNNSV